MSIETPECNRLSAVSEMSQGIGEFLDWLGSQGMVIHEWTTGLTNWYPCSGYGINGNCENGIDGRGNTCRACDGAGGREGEIADRFVPISTTFEALLARYYDIDLSKVDRERRAVLDSLRDRPSRPAETGGPGVSSTPGRPRPPEFETEKAVRW